MFLIGLTGGIASGKSTVAEMLRTRGAEEIDADQIAREVVALGTEGLGQVVGEFGADVLDSTGALDRSKLGQLVFANPDRRKSLEAILHPLIRRRTGELIGASNADIVVYSVPLLVESGVDHDFDLVVTVEAGEQSQIKRMTSSRGMTESEAENRLSAQATREERLKRADVTLDNSGSLEQLELQVDQLWSKIVKLAAEKKSSSGTN